MSNEVTQLQDLNNVSLKGFPTKGTLKKVIQRQISYNTALDNCAQVYTKQCFKMSYLQVNRYLLGRGGKELLLFQRGVDHPGDHGVAEEDLPE